MEVILLGATPPPIGGIAKWTLRMMNSELEDNWKIILVDEKILGERSMFGDNRRKNILFELKRWTRVWMSVWKNVKSDSVRIVHSTPIATSTSMLAEMVNCCIAHLHKKKFIIHFRCTVPNMISKMPQRFLLKVFCNMADIIITLNSQTSKYLQEITKTKCILVPNFVDADEINTEKQTNESVTTILYVGGVIKEKGCDKIVEIADRFPDIQFRLVGDYDSYIEELSRNHTNIILTGSKSKQEVINELKSADVFIFLSRYAGEGFSNSLAEAMAAGLPCIVTDWAANNDMIGNTGGIVVQNTEKEMIVSAIEKIRDPDLRKVFSRNNINKVKNEYSSKHILKEYVNIYNSLI